MSEQARRKHFYFKAKLNEVSAESQTDTFSSQLGRFFMSHLVDCQWPCVLVATPLYGDHLKPTVTIGNCFVYNSSKKCLSYNCVLVEHISICLFFLFSLVCNFTNG